MELKKKTKILIRNFGNIQKSSVLLLVEFKKENFFFGEKATNRQNKIKNKQKKNLHQFHHDDKIQNSFLNKQTKLHCHQIHHVKFYDLNLIDRNLMINHARPVTINKKKSIKKKKYKPKQKKTH